MQIPLWVFCLSSPLGVSHCVPIGRCRVLISIISWHCMDYLPVPAFICHNAVTQPGFQAALQWLFSALCGTPLPGLPNTLDCLSVSLHSPNGRQIACGQGCTRDWKIVRNPIIKWMTSALQLSQMHCSCIQSQSISIWTCHTSDYTGQL